MSSLPPSGLGPIPHPGLGSAQQIALGSASARFDKVASFQQAMPRLLDGAPSHQQTAIRHLLTGCLAYSHPATPRYGSQPAVFAMLTTPKARLAETEEVITRLAQHTERPLITLDLAQVHPLAAQDTLKAALMEQLSAAAASSPKPPILLLKHPSDASPDVLNLVIELADTAQFLSPQGLPVSLNGADLFAVQTVPEPFINPKTLNLPEALSARIQIRSPF
jgi:hypothetical protein